MAEYPHFIPPQDLAVRAVTEWSAAEADRYREWLIGELPRRTDALLRFLAQEPRDDAVAELGEVGARAAPTLTSGGFARQTAGNWQLTEAGHALAADLGLLVARRLLEHHPESLRWQTVRKPRRDMSYNLPVLVGFSTGMYLEPVGGSIAEAHAVLRGTRGADAWQRIYSFWSARAEP